LRIDPISPPDPSELNEKLSTIIKRIKAGCPQAKEEFADLLYPEVERLIYKFHYSREELKSNAGWIIAKLISKIDMFDDDQPPLGYIYRSSRNFCIDEHRKHSTRKKRETLYAKKHLAYPPRGIPDPSINLLLEELLEPEDAKIFQSFYLEGKSFEAIADITGQKPKRIKDTLDRLERVVTDEILSWYQE
jgi:RNA polymerase sigma factor (sigma-70 family)